MYINDLPRRINFWSEPIIFTVDTGVVIDGQTVDDFSLVSNTILPRMTKWFTVNVLALNLDKTNILKCKMNNSP